MAADIAADRYVAVTLPVMQKITGLESLSAASLAAEVALPPPADLAVARPGQLGRVLVLDGVQDPGNLVSWWVCGLVGKWAARQAGELASLSMHAWQQLVL
jgi:hypothetical protein